MSIAIKDTKITILACTKISIVAGRIFKSPDCFIFRSLHSQQSIFLKKKPSSPSYHTGIKI